MEKIFIKNRKNQKIAVLVGHSMGGLCTALFAEKHPQKVKALASISAAVSGKLSGEAHGEEMMDNWQKTGWLVEKSANRPGLIKKLKWSHFLDRLKYDLLPNADKLVMPVLMIVGEKDKTTPPRHQQTLFDKLPGLKEIHIIKKAPHSFREENHLRELKKIFSQWVGKLN